MRLLQVKDAVCSLRYLLKILVRIISGISVLTVTQGCIWLYRNLQRKAAVADATRQLIVGINRIMTGMLIDDTNSILWRHLAVLLSLKSVSCARNPFQQSAKQGKRDGDSLNGSSKPCLEFRMAEC